MQYFDGAAVVGDPNFYRNPGVPGAYVIGSNDLTATPNDALIQSARSTGTNIYGSNLILASGVSTGTPGALNGGSVQIKTSIPSVNSPPAVFNAAVF